MRKLWITLPILFFGYVGQVEANNDVHCLAENIYHEARGESTAGKMAVALVTLNSCLLYTSPSPRDRTRSRMPSSA